MNWIKRKKEPSDRVEQIPVCRILPNPHQPRTAFDGESLEALSRSIRRYGILQPISVRKTGDGYELIAGERRLRAARMAGMATVPCLIYQVDSDQSALLAVMENLLREDLNLFETASAMDRLCREYGLTQEEIAARLSVSQSYVANKLRLLRFDEEERQQILAGALTERHARALLRLEGEKRREALARVLKEKMNVAATEAYVEGLLQAPPGKKKPKEKRWHGVIRDLRIFYNSVERAMEMVRRCGVPVESRKEEGENETRLIIRIPKDAVPR